MEVREVPCCQAGDSGKSCSLSPDAVCWEIPSPSGKSDSALCRLSSDETRPTTLWRGVCLPQSPLVSR